MSFIISDALADGINNVAPIQPAQPSLMAMLMPFGLMFLVFYFLMIRPQQKKMKEQENLINSIQKGEEIVTQSGIFGKVTEVADKIVTLEIANNVRIKILKTQIATVLRGEQKA